MIAEPRAGNGAVSSAAGEAVLLKARIRHSRMAGGLLLLAMILSLPAWRSEGLLHEALDWAGYAAVIACVLGRSWCAAYIGGRKNEELVTVGPFSVVRNPLYAFTFLGALGIGLCTATLTFTLLLPVAFALYYRVVVRREEAFLDAAFGDDYRRYAARVPRWIPEPRLWRDRAEVRVRPHFLLHTIRDSAAFFIAPPVLELVETLHDTGALPWLVRLP